MADPPHVAPREPHLIEIAVSHRDGGARITLRRRGDDFEGTAEGGFGGPSDEAQRVELDVRPEWGEKVFRQARELRPLPPIPGGHMGMDGTDHHLAIGTGRERVAFTWWLDAPDAWAPIERLYQRIRRRYVRKDGAGPLEARLW